MGGGVCERLPPVKVVVTGGSGKAGRAVVGRLLERGHEVLNVDVAPSPESHSHDSPAPFLAADVTDFGQAFEALNGGAARMPAPDAVVHLAAVPSPVHGTPDRTFRTNVLRGFGHLRPGIRGLQLQVGRLHHVFWSRPERCAAAIASVREPASSLRRIAETW